MSKQYDRNHALITIGERQFARRVIYQFRAQDPPPAWYNLIPFTFLFEYIRIRRAITAFQKDAMTVRKAALDKARATLEGEDAPEIDDRMQRQIRDWLSGHGLFLPSVAEKQEALAGKYAAHFTRLLEAHGREYEDLVRAVYRIPPNYREFLEDVETMEKAIDKTVCEFLQETGKKKEYCDNRMERKQTAFARAREIEIDRIFG